MPESQVKKGDKSEQFEMERMTRQHDGLEWRESMREETEKEGDKERRKKNRTKMRYIFF